MQNFIFTTLRSINKVKPVLNGPAQSFRYLKLTLPPNGVDSINLFGGRVMVSFIAHNAQSSTFGDIEAEFVLTLHIPYIRWITIDTVWLEDQTTHRSCYSVHESRSGRAISLFYLCRSYGGRHVTFLTLNVKILLSLPSIRNSGKLLLHISCRTSCKRILFP